ncbi:MAG: hypothetical protein IJT73_06885 [Selenomonadaceae bacterium]|nr:hypothetical protein [Selenomonadaceae bacterium]
MKLRKILHKLMYLDRVDVYRAKLTTIGRTDDYTTEFELIHEKIPCKLSQYGKTLYSHRDDTSQKLTDDLRLCYDPEIVILPNDFLVINHQGQEWKLFAGEQFNYPTHTELSVRRRRESGQT